MSLHQPFLIPSVIFIVIALPLVLGWIPPNRFYGVRTRSTLADPGLWYRANRAGGWLLLGAGSIYLVVAALTAAWPPADQNFAVWLLHLAAFGLPLLAGLVLLRGYIRRG